MAETETLIIAGIVAIGAYFFYNKKISGADMEASSGSIPVGNNVYVKEREVSILDPNKMLFRDIKDDNSVIIYKLPTDDLSASERRAIQNDFYRITKDGMIDYTLFPKTKDAIDDIKERILVKDNIKKSSLSPDKWLMNVHNNDGAITTYKGNRFQMGLQAISNWWNGNKEIPAIETYTNYNAVGTTTTKAEIRKEKTIKSTPLTSSTIKSSSTPLTSSSRKRTYVTPTQSKTISRDWKNAETKAEKRSAIDKAWKEAGLT